jgi:hypothetical protein
MREEEIEPEVEDDMRARAVREGRGDCQVGSSCQRKNKGKRIPLRV